MESNLSRLPFRVYEFERSFDEQGAIEWFQENWNKSFVFSMVYAALIFGGQYVMKERRKFELRLPLILWSLSLALFSIIGALRTGWYMGHILITSGFKQSVCDQGFYKGPVSKFWAYAFVISKVPELGDTLFIVLRKQKLIFLHWYHHITVLLYTWYTYKDMVAGGGWFMTMNYGVHAVMYSYYALRAAQLHVPRFCAMFITLTQILQMVMGLAVNVLVHSWMQDGTCPSTWENIFCSSVMYFSYLLLFCSFFYKAYLKGKERAKAD
ncbi:elongation of very long chain fatty acids protein 6 isoform X1 [Microcaecilia unicolor]|uniref:Elongation of very long chain fatty acids protein n=2 Tax=Microcaecilia unicolor TaxID=1415580 RepID=A0A6P7Y321_9AMPH|nr:elongation of very long chain fatty acids protein 6-like isoform X1 [Microcaecilia unicolor]